MTSAVMLVALSFFLIGMLIGGVFGYHVAKLEKSSRDDESGGSP